MSTGSGTNDKVSEVNSNYGGANGQPLYLTYPVNTLMELTLAPNREIVRGLIYTTDEISNCIVLRRSLKHTTLASEIRICNAASVLERKVVKSASGSAQTEEDAILQKKTNSSKTEEFPEHTTNLHSDNTENDRYSSYVEITPLPVVSKKTLEEREKRAFRLAEESFAHINQKVNRKCKFCFVSIFKNFIAFPL